MPTTKITVDPEFASLIPPPTKDERDALTQSLMDEGCTDALVVWGEHGILLDGHTRFEIVSDLGIPYKTRELSFDDRASAALWILRHQMARRNISDFQKGALALAMKPHLAEQAKERQKRKTESPEKSVPAQCAGTKSPETAEIVAKKAGVGTRNLFKIEHALDEGAAPIVAMAKAGEVSISAADKIASLPKSEQRAIAKGGPAAVKAAAAELRKPAAAPVDVDALGTPLETEKLRKAFATVPAFKALVNDLTQLYKRATALSDNPAVAVWFEGYELRQRYTNLRMYLTDSTPHAICKHCSGAGCAVCKKTGYVTAFHHKTFKDGTP